MRNARWRQSVAHLALVMVVAVTAAGLVGCEPELVTPLPCVRVFGAAETEAVNRRSPGHNITASVWDERSQCRYDLNPQHRVTEASLFKVSILGRVLRRAQDEGRGLTPWEHDRVWPMVTQSQDVPTDDLYYSLGGRDAANQFFRDVGMFDTFVPSDLWGSTVTSAADQMQFVRMVAGDRSDLLNENSKNWARWYMGNVIPSQRWGISAGLPAGSGFVNKNGFFPIACCGWRINSDGRVTPPGGGGYDVAVLSDGWASQAEGVLAIEGVARLINDALARDAPGSGPFGSLDVVRPGSTAGTVEVAGWTVDPDTSAPVPVHLVIDGAGAQFLADQPRSDVGSAYPGAGPNHGFTFTLPAGSSGAHVVCVDGMNVAGTPGSDALIGCQPVIVPG